MDETNLKINLQQLSISMLESFQDKSQVANLYPKCNQRLTSGQASLKRGSGRACDKHRHSSSGRQQALPSHTCPGIPCDAKQLETAAQSSSTRLEAKVPQGDGTSKYGDDVIVTATLEGQKCSNELQQVSHTREDSIPTQAMPGAHRHVQSRRGSLAFRNSVLATVEARQALAERVQKDTPTILPPSDRVGVLKALEQAPGAGRGGPRELAAVLRLLQKVPLLSLMHEEALLEIGRHARYLFLQPNSVVFKQGEMSSTFYIIATGCVELHVAGDDVAPIVSKHAEKILHSTALVVEPGSQISTVQSASTVDAALVATLEPGQTFGEKALAKTGMGRRTATIVTTTDCELLVVDCQLYSAVLAKLHQEGLEYKIDALRNFDISNDWKESQLREVAGVLSLKKLPRDRVIAQQGSPSTSLYFIKAGEVRVVRHMPASPHIRRLLSNSVMVSQFRPDSNLRDRLKETAHRGGMGSGKHGQDLAGSCGDSMDLYHHMLPYDQKHEGPEDMYVELATLGPLEIFGEVGAAEGTWRETSVITSSYTEVLELTRHDLLTRLKGACRVCLESVRETRPSDEKLLKSLAQELEWQRYKHRLIAGTLWEGGKGLGMMVRYQGE